MKNDMSLMCFKQLLPKLEATINVIQNYLNLFPLVSFTKYFDTSTSLIITSYKY